jgi:hypothetical protein
MVAAAWTILDYVLSEAQQDRRLGPKAVMDLIKTYLKNDASYTVTTKGGLGFVAAPPIAGLTEHFKKWDAVTASVRQAVSESGRGSVIDAEDDPECHEDPDDVPADVRQDDSEGTQNSQLHLGGLLTCSTLSHYYLTKSLTKGFSR